MARRKKKKFKQIEFGRDLSKSEIKTLDFLWYWKVAPASLIKEKIFKSTNWWSFYKIIRRLKMEKIVYEIPKGQYIHHRLLALTELGYELFSRDWDYVSSHRFRVHTPAHDYIATALQIGDFLHSSSVDINLVSEQKIQVASEDELPFGYSKLVANRNDFHSGHVPDGLTEVYNGKDRFVLGYEVEINLKPKPRYEAMFKYWFNHRYGKYNNPDTLFFVVKNAWIAKKIVSYEDNAENKIRFAFVDLNDFIQLGWEAPVRQGMCAGLSIRKIHENYLQNAGKDISKVMQKPDWAIFFPKYRSPQKSIAYAKAEHAACDKHYTPSLEGANLNKVIES